MNKDILFSIFAKLYYLHQKFTYNACIENFSNMNQNCLYVDYFIKINKCEFVAAKNVANNKLRRKRAYDRFKFAVSLYYTFFNMYYIIVFCGVIICLLTKKILSNVNSAANYC